MKQVLKAILKVFVILIGIGILLLGGLTIYHRIMLPKEEVKLKAPGILVVVNGFKSIQSRVWS